MSRFLISSTFLREATGVSIVCTFWKIGTIKLPQRQINGSSYRIATDDTDETRTGFTERGTRFDTAVDVADEWCDGAFAWR